MHFDHSHKLQQAGLNIHAVFNLSELPEELTAQLQQHSDLSQYNQLILVGHRGPLLWQQLKAGEAFKLPAPIDDYSRQQIEACLASVDHVTEYCFLYPSDKPINLQGFGELAGWHHASPFMVGVNSEWGSWFAYRALLLANSRFEVIAAEATESPCLTCKDTPCITACPADAIGAAKKDLQACIDYRIEEQSPCASQCLARNSCPVKPEFRYEQEQITYHYQQSLNMIRQWQEDSIS